MGRLKQKKNKKGRVCDPQRRCRACGVSVSSSRLLTKKNEKVEYDEVEKEEEPQMPPELILGITKPLKGSSTASSVELIKILS